MQNCTARTHLPNIGDIEENRNEPTASGRLTGAVAGGYSAQTHGADSQQDGQGAEFSPAELLREGCIFLEELHRVILQTAELYRVGSEQDGNGQFIELTHALEWFANLVSSACQVPEFNLASAEMNGDMGAEPVAGLNGILMEIVSAQEQRDLVLMTDLLEYELAPQVKSWQDTFIRLRDTHEER
jgi:hypothetical protein